MKTPQPPANGDMVDARGIDSRQKRDDSIQPASPPMPGPSHTHDAYSGTETLALIERALLRLSYGTYGVCVCCGADISLERLDENPAIETCSSCEGANTFKAH